MRPLLDRFRGNLGCAVRLTIGSPEGRSHPPQSAGSYRSGARSKGRGGPAQPPHTARICRLRKRKAGSEKLHRSSTWKPLTSVWRSGTDDSTDRNGRYIVTIVSVPTCTYGAFAILTRDQQAYAPNRHSYASTIQGQLVEPRSTHIRYRQVQRRPERTPYPFDIYEIP